MQNLMRYTQKPSMGGMSMRRNLFMVLLVSVVLVGTLAFA
jgi:hypothetical protein